MAAPSAVDVAAARAGRTGARADRLDVAAGAASTSTANPSSVQRAQDAAAVLRARLAPDQPRALQPAHGVGEPAARVHHPVGQLGHPQPPVRRLGELHEDLVLGQATSPLSSTELPAAAGPCSSRVTSRIGPPDVPARRSSSQRGTVRRRWLPDRRRRTPGQVIAGQPAGDLGRPVGQHDRRPRPAGSTSASPGSRGPGRSSRWRPPPRPSRTPRTPGRRRPARRPRRATAATHVEVGQRRLDHDQVGALGEVERHLAQRLAAVGRVLLVGAPVAVQASTRPPRGTARRTPRRTWPRRRGSPTSVCPAPSSAARTAPTWPSIIPLGPTRCDAGLGQRDAPSRRTAPASRRCRPGRPRSSTPQWPWSVNSSRHRSAITTRSSPTSATTSRTATLRMPSGSVGARADGVLALRDPEQHDPAEPRARPPRRPPCAGESRVCWTTPGIDAIGVGALGALLDEHRQHQLGRVQPGLGDQPAQRRRAAQPARPAAGKPRRLGEPAALTSPSAGSRPCAGSAAAPARPASTADSRSPAPYSASAVDQRVGARLGGQDVDPQAVLLGGLRGRGPMHATTVRGVRLAGDADQVAHRRAGGEDHGVELAGLDRLADVGGRRRGAHRPVGGDVVDLPADLLQPGDQGVGGDVGARQEHPVDRVEHVVVRRPDLQQPAGGLLVLAGRHQVGLDAPVAQRGRGHPADGGDLEPGEGPGVQAELLELLADRPHGVDRGEPDPLVAAGDQALDGLLHLVRGARRLDRDGRHDLGRRRRARPAASTIEPACSLVRGTSTRQPNSGLVSNHDAVSRSPAASPTTAITGWSSRAAGSAVATSASVHATRALVAPWCPCAVTATGVCGVAPGGEQARGRRRRTSSASAEDDDGGPGAGVHAPSRRRRRAGARRARRPTPAGVSGTPA